MRRDVIFYRLFQRSPRLLFEFVESPPPQAQNYRFESVEIIELPKTQPLDSAYGADDRPRQSSQTIKPDNQARQPSRQSSH